MHRGKQICEELKALRRNIAEENGIPLEQKPCTHKGDCRGTCPYCEAEMRYLERSLASRIKLGQVATIAGLTLGLALSGNAMAQEVNPTVPHEAGQRTASDVEVGTLKGMVFDNKTNAPIPIAQYRLLRDGQEVASGVSDLDGLITVKSIPLGTYRLQIKAWGYKPVDTTLTMKHQGFTVFHAPMAPISSKDSSVVKMFPMIEIGTECEASSAVPGENADPIPMIGEVQVKLPGTPASLPDLKEEQLMYEEEKIETPRVIIVR
ncbi:MAG: carboxypeptidase-like regulatory domain-containing protein [Bacteroidales bacterium]|nr:carboxypeptidase-like regulatory domain-containing protein [Bacteroidales bacterium]